MPAPERLRFVRSLLASVKGMPELCVSWTSAVAVRFIWTILIKHSLILIVARTGPPVIQNRQQVIAHLAIIGVLRPLRSSLINERHSGSRAKRVFRNIVAILFARRGSVHS